MSDQTIKTPLATAAAAVGVLVLFVDANAFAWRPRHRHRSGMVAQRPHIYTWPAHTKQNTTATMTTTKPVSQ